MPIDEPGRLGPLFEEHPSAVNNDELGWDRMGERLFPPRKKRRLVAWWWLLPFLVGGILLTLVPEAISSSGNEVERERSITTVLDTPATKPRMADDPQPPIESATTAPTSQPLLTNSKPTNTAPVSPAAPPKTEQSDQAKPNLLEAASTTPRSEAWATPLLPVRIKSPEIPVTFDLPALEGAIVSLPSNRLNTFLEISGGVNYYKRSFSRSFTLPVTGSYGEEGQAGYQAGFLIGQQLDQRWSLAAGLSLRQQRYRAYLQREENAKLYRPGTVDTIFRNVFTGEETVVLTDSVGGVRRRTFGHHNRVTTLSIPLLLITEEQWDRFHVGLRGGGRFIIERREVGRTVTRSGEVISLDDELESGANTGWRWQVGGHLRYRLRPKMGLLLRADYQFGSVDEPGLPMLSLGVRFR